MNYSPALWFGHIHIRQDQQGRYCLNDLHKAAGGEPRHQPHRFLRNERTKRLMALLESEASAAAGERDLSSSFLRNSNYPKMGSLVVHTVEGRDGGTYVPKLLVFAYGAWVSAEFDKLILETFDAAVTGQLVRQARQVRQFEATYFARHPRDQEIRRLALTSEPYWMIARAVRCGIQTVGRALRRMIEWGLIGEAQFRSARARRLVNCYRPLRLCS